MDEEKNRSTLQIGSDSFDKFYWGQFSHIMDEKEFELFKQTLYKKLPVTFRVNPSHSHHEEIIKMLLAPDFVEKFVKKSEKDTFD